MSKKLIAILCILLLAGCAQQTVEEPKEPVVELEEVEAEAEPTVDVQETEPEAIPEEVEEEVEEITTEPTEAKETTTLLEGVFTKKAHTTTGSVQIIEMADGKKMLSFQGFKTDPGPALHVYLYNDDIKQGVDLGELISITGNYQYDIPEDIDVNEYKKVAIYCVPFGVIFGEAKLS